MPREVIEIKGLAGVLSMLKKLPPELVSKRGGVVLSGLRKGGNVIRKAWRQEIQRVIDTPNAAGNDDQSTGLYQKSLLVSRMRDPKRKGADEGVVVRPKRAKYPDGDTVGKIAGLLETGTESAPAFAPMRKAFDSAKTAALEAVVKGINDGIQKAVKKLDKTA